VSLEGVVKEVVTTPSNQVVQKVYRVAVQDGQLTLRLRDLGGSDPNAVINALVVTKVDVPTGSLEVTLGPPAAVAAGALWRVDGGQWQASKAIVSGLEVGIHQVEYAPAKGWDGPPAEPVTISLGQTTSLARTYTVSAVVARLDFGTASSPVAAGYERVTEATAYKAPPGYGWLAGKVASVDVATGTDLERDFCYSPDMTFGVDVPAGTYDVALSMGNMKWSHDQIEVSLEGVVKEVVTTPLNQVVQKVYSVTVQDGQLTLRLRDLGGSDVNAVINALVVTRTGPPPAPAPEELAIGVMPESGPAPLHVQALALGVPPETACEWDFGDGTRLRAGDLVSHTYFSPGTYTITLTADGRTARATVVVAESPPR
jgi:PKD repeat protein